MKYLSGASLLHVIPAAHRTTSKLSLAAPERARGAPGEATARSLARRLALALHDLGLDGLVPAGWITVDGASIRLGDLDVPTADDLVRHLEDLAVSVGPVLDDAASDQRSPGSGQAALFGRGDR